MRSVTIHVVHETRAEWSARQITGRASYWRALRESDRAYLIELEAMVAVERDPFKRAALRKLRDEYRRDEADAREIADQLRRDVLRGLRDRRESRGLRRLIAPK